MGKHALRIKKTKIAYTDEEKAKAFADTMEQKCKENFH